jgi:hypothetical protein
LIDRLENIEKQVQALQDSLNGRFSHGNYKWQLLYKLNIH